MYSYRSFLLVNIRYRELKYKSIPSKLSIYLK
jgi:hypothetical protein